jgi:hypothetical protein
MVSGMAVDSQAEFVHAARFYCKACDVGEAVTASASSAEKERFNRFCKAHAGHNADLLAREKARTTIVTGRVVG